MNIVGLNIVDGILVDTSGKQVRFEPVLIRGQGWTVERVTGGRRKGRAIDVEPGYEGCAYTLHQAQLASDSLTRDVWRALRLEVSK